MALRSIDLMVGDWVRPTRLNKPARIEEVSRLLNRVIVITADGYESAHILECNPIPLTPEILEKNGFKDEGYFGKLDIEDFHVLCDTKNVAIFHNEHTDVDIPIMYVHELQRALYLCKIDKTIEL